MTRIARRRPAFDDGDVFLNVDEFAELISVLDETGAALRTFAGIFNDPATNNTQTGKSFFSKRRAPRLGDYAVDATSPWIDCLYADVVALKRGDAVAIEGEVFELITSPQPDGTGWARLELAPAGDAV